jgi:hypothetical protein
MFPMAYKIDPLQSRLFLVSAFSGPDWQLPKNRLKNGLKTGRGNWRKTVQKLVILICQ